MVVYNYSGKEINAKIVYYGPALSGKTTNLEWIYSKIPLEYSGKMISLRTQTDRTIFFDFLPLELGLIDGFKTRFMLYTVPGQVYYNATRKMVLKGADGVVFVADSEAGRMADNLESLQNLRDNLVEIGIDPDSIPIVLQWNKRDLPATEELSTLERQLNPEGHPSYGACALTGEGVYETLHQISRLIYRKLTAEEGASPVPGAEGLDENSLFGDDIAERLRDVDEVDPTWEEPIRVDPLSAVPNPSTKEGAVLDTILGSLGVGGQEPERTAEAVAPSPPPPSVAETPPAPPRTVESEQQEVPVEVSMGASSRTQGSAQGALSEIGGRPAMSDRNAPHTPPTPQSVAPEGQERTPQATPRPSAPAASDPSGAPAHPRPHAEAEPTATPPAPPQAPAPQAPAYHEEPRAGQGDEMLTDLVDNLFSERDEDGVSYGSDFGRMVDLGPDSDAGKTPTADSDFELPQDLLDSGQFSPVIPEAQQEVEPLELITDPKKSPSEKVSDRTSGSAAPSGRASSGFQPLASGTRTIEVPVSVDADLLADGKTLRIVLNLKMRR